MLNPFMSKKKSGHEKGPWCNLGRLYRVIKGQKFSLFIAVLIIANAILIGSTTELEMRDAIADRNVLGSSNPSLHRLVLTFDVFFTVIFTTELFLRVLVMQQLFCLSPDWYWNGFDTLIVIAALVEVALTSYSFE